MIYRTSPLILNSLKCKWIGMIIKDYKPKSDATIIRFTNLHYVHVRKLRNFNCNKHLNLRFTADKDFRAGKFLGRRIILNGQVAHLVRVSIFHRLRVRIPLSTWPGRGMKYCWAASSISCTLLVHPAECLGTRAWGLMGSCAVQHTKKQLQWMATVIGATSLAECIYLPPNTLW